MITSLKRIMVPAAISLMPIAVLAQTRAIEDIFGDLTSFLNTVITFLILLATVIFLWGIVKYITAGGDEEKVKEARNLIIWGIVFLAVMVAVWGLVNILLDFICGTSECKEDIPEGPQQ